MRELKGTWKEIGQIDVDSGGIWLGDPCYVLPDDASHKVKDWYEDFCKPLFELWDKEGTDRAACNKMAFEPLGSGVGLSINTYYGDGSYGVYGLFDDTGRITAVMVDFLGFWEEDE